MTTPNPFAIAGDALAEQIRIGGGDVAGANDFAAILRAAAAFGERLW